MTEVWKDIGDWPFHQVSNFGRVRVLPGGYVRNRPIIETEIRTLSPHNGYMIIQRGFTDKWGHYARRLRIHHLVLNAFCGPCPPGQECRHFNGDRSDNRWPENIAWGTSKENYQDRVRHGTDNKGERNGMTKLTRPDVDNIRKSTKSYSQLAKEYGITDTAISDIRNYHNWKD